jgi:hypothetical protein
LLEFKKHECAGKDVVVAATSLHKLLQSIEVFTIDAQIANYVFFPVANIFRESTNLPSQATGAALKCMHVLLSSGWSHCTSPALCKELLVLLNFVLSHNQSDTSKIGGAFPDDIKMVASQCLKQIFDFLKLPICQLTQERGSNAEVVIGGVIASLLESLKNCYSVEARVEAGEALVSLAQCLQQNDILFTFLPGTISSLTSLVELHANGRGQYRVIVLAVRGMHAFLRATVFDTRLAGPTGDLHEQSCISQPDKWLRQHKTQLSAALSKVLMARDHERSEVQQALYELCRTTAHNHSYFLRTSTGSMIETLIVLSHSEKGSRPNQRISQVESMFNEHEELLQQLKDMMYAWLLKLPQVSQSMESETYRELLERVSTTYGIIAHIDPDMTFLQKALWNSVVESALLLLPGAMATSVDAPVPNIGDYTLAPARSTESQASSTEIVTFNLIESNSSLAHLQSFVDEILSKHLDRSVVGGLPDMICGLDDDRAQPGLWLTIRLATSIRETGMQVESSLLWDQGLVDDAYDQKAMESALQVAYATALNILKTSTHTDKNIVTQILSLGTVAIQAYQQELHFLPELVDVLFPVVERVGSSHVEVRSAAMNCLSVIASSIGVTSVRELLVNNADYLLNTIALRIDALDISVQTPSILEVLVQICGSNLIPYLDDIIAAIISILSSYHGYPVLVESLFSVLEVIVSQMNALTTVTQSTRHSTRPNDGKPITISHIPAIVDEIGQSSNTRQSKMSTLQSNSSGSMDEVVGDRPESLAKVGTEHTSPMMLAKTILTLTQFHLNSGSSQLRVRLLKLIEVGCAILACDEDQFLPLLNDIWPLVIKRLFDNDPNTSVTATGTLEVMFEYAGDFLSSRVQDEWAGILACARQLEKKITLRSQRVNDDGRFSTENRAWQGMLRLLVSVIKNIRLTPEMEDACFILLTPFSEGYSSVKDALDNRDADRFWLYRLALTGVQSIKHQDRPAPPPRYADLKFAAFIST